MLAENIGGGDEAKDEGKAGSYGSDGGPVPRRDQEREASAAGPVREEYTYDFDGQGNWVKKTLYH